MNLWMYDPPPTPMLVITTWLGNGLDGDMWIYFQISKDMEYNIREGFNKPTFTCESIIKL